MAACCGETSCGLRDGRARPRDVIRADRSDGRSLPRCGSRRPELPEAARGMWPAPSSAWPASTGALPGIIWPLYLVRVFTHGRRTRPCAIARAPGPTAKARVSLQTAEQYVAVEALVRGCDIVRTFANRRLRPGATGAFRRSIELVHSRRL